MTHNAATVGPRPNALLLDRLLAERSGEREAFVVVSATQLMKDLAVSLRQSIGADFAMVGTVREDSTMELDSLSGAKSVALRGLQLLPGQGLGGHVLQSASLAVVDHYLTDSSITHEFDTAVAAEGLESIVAMPVLAGGRVVAVAYGAHRRGVPYQGRSLDRLMSTVRETEQRVQLALESESMAQLAAAEERERIAHSLHDSVGALLFGIEAGAKRIGEVAKNDVDVRDRADEILASAAAAASALRESISGLTANGTVLSPITTLRSDLRDLQERSTIEAQLVLPRGVPDLSDYHGDLLVRTVRELLLNVERHSGADHLLVSIYPESDGIATAIADNGTGTVDSIIEGTGLSSCRSRIERVGGSMKFKNDPDDQGLTVKVWMPM